MHADAKETVATPRVIACVEMRPFCLGHHLLFLALGLPFAGNPDADCTAEDVVIGIAVCGGGSYEETLGAIHGGTWPETIARWRRAAAGPWWNPRTVDMGEAAELFREYLREGYRMPPLWRHANAHGLELSAPWEQLLKVQLVKTGFSESEVLNGYLPARWYDYFTSLELSAAASCGDPKSWRKVFYTREDAEALI